MARPRTHKVGAGTCSGLVSASGSSCEKRAIHSRRRPSRLRWATDGSSPEIMVLEPRLLVRRLKNAPFVRNVFVVMTGSVTAQAFALALSPVISRLYTPADFGVFGSFGAVTTVIASVATLGYAEAIMLPKRREDAGQVCLLCGLVTLAMTLLCAGICLLFPNRLLGLLKTQSVWSLVLLVLTVLAAGINASFLAWCIRVKAFKHTSASQVLRGLSSNSLQVGFGLLRGGAQGLVVSSVLADFAASGNLLRVVRSSLTAALAHARWRRVKELAAEYRDFPVYAAPMDGVNALSRGLPVLLLAHFYGIQSAGAYAFGVRILQTPMSLVTAAVRQVLFQRASETQNNGGPLFRLYVSTTGGLFALACLPSVILFVWSPIIVVWVFGPQWRVAGDYARWLVMWLLFVFCNVPSVLFARVIRIQRKMMAFEVALLFGRTLALVLGGLYLAAEHTILMFALVGTLVNVVQIAFVGRAVKKREQVLEGADHASLV
jgi:lipopolysaccharide exporter